MKPDILSTMEELVNEEGGIYSNINHQLNSSLIPELIKKEGVAYSQHSAWNFCGYIWFEKGKFHEQVWQYKSPKDELEDEDLQSLIDRVNSEYGHQ